MNGYLLAGIIILGLPVLAWFGWMVWDTGRWLAFLAFLAICAWALGGSWLLVEGLLRQYP